MSKPISGGGALQNGDSSLGDAAKRLGNLDRSQRRMLSYSGGQEVSEIVAICDQRRVLPVSDSSIQAFNGSTGIHVRHERGSSLCAPQRHSAAHISVYFPGPDCERSEIKPDTESGVRIRGILLSDGVLHLSPVDGQMEATVDALALCQECELSLQGSG